MRYKERQRKGYKREIETVTKRHRRVTKRDIEWLTHITDKDWSTMT